MISATNTPLSQDLHLSAEAALKDAPRIEILTLVQALDNRPDVLGKANAELADALNDGWEILHIGVTSSRIGNFTQQTRIVTLHRLVEPEDEAPDADEAEAQSEATLAEADATIALNGVGDAPLPVLDDDTPELDETLIHAPIAEPAYADAATRPISLPEGAGAHAVLTSW